MPHECKIVTVHDAPDALAELSADLKARAAGESPNAPEIFVVIHGLPRFKKLRYEDDFSFSHLVEQTEPVLPGFGSGHALHAYSVHQPQPTRHPPGSGHPPPERMRGPVRPGTG